MIYFKLFITFILITTLISCEGEGNNKPETPNSPVGSEYEADIISTDTGYYFSIEKDSKAIIIQKNIPAISGNKLFATPEEAQRVAELMIWKMENDIFPPTVTISELDSLNIIY